jgi:hypothetical protein
VPDRIWIEAERADFSTRDLILSVGPGVVQEKFGLPSGGIAFALRDSR